MLFCAPRPRVQNVLCLSSTWPGLTHRDEPASKQPYTWHNTFELSLFCFLYLLIFIMLIILVTTHDQPWTQWSRAISRYVGLVIQIANVGPAGYALLRHYNVASLETCTAAVLLLGAVATALMGKHKTAPPSPLLLPPHSAFYLYYRRPCIYGAYTCVRLRVE